jgi:UrcA family protein
MSRAQISGKENCNEKKSYPAGSRDDGICVDQQHWRYSGTTRGHGAREAYFECYNRKPTAMNPPILDVSLSYGVSTAGLNLGTQAGAAELEKRVRDAATAACEELGRKYSDATPSDADCIKAATNEAMVRVRELEAAAAKKSTK